MILGDLLDEIRNRYLAQFHETVSELTRAGRRAIAEAAFRDKRGALVEDGALRLPLRGDLFAITDGQQPEPVSIDSEAILSFEPITFEWSGGLPTRVAPFHWDACDLRVMGIPTSTDWSHLRDWFARWFDGDDARPTNERGFSGVIHFLSDPTREGSATIFQVDFGSAPVEAFEELLDALRDSGATRIEIGHDHTA